MSLFAASSHRWQTTEFPRTVELCSAKYRSTVVWRSFAASFSSGVRRVGRAAIAQQRAAAANATNVSFIVDEIA